MCCSLGFSVRSCIYDKIGIDPQVKRIGDYKSAGDQLLWQDIADQLLRGDMSNDQIM